MADTTPESEAWNSIAPDLDFDPQCESVDCEQFGHVHPAKWLVSLKCGHTEYWCRGRFAHHVHPNFHLPETACVHHGFATEVSSWLGLAPTKIERQQRPEWQS